MNKLEFCKEYDLTEDQFYGKELIPGSLNLDSLKTIPEGFNPIVGRTLYLPSLQTIPSGFNPVVGGSLFLRSLTNIPEGFNPIVGRSLYLDSLETIPEGFNPIVGGNLYLNSLTTIPKGFNPVIGGNLWLSSLTSIPEGFNPVVGGNLVLPSLQNIPEGFNPVVGGSLFLYSLETIPKGFSPVVGGGLWLSSLTSIPKGFNPVVGGILYLNSLETIPEGFNPTCNSIESSLDLPFTKIPDNCLIYYRDKTYIRSDGIFLELVKKKGVVYKCKRINGKDFIYIVTDGNGKFAHGKSIGEAGESLKYKITNRDKSRYKKLGVRSKLKFGEMIECYRVITGACEYGVREFLSRKGIKEGKYSIGEVIKLTYKEYGGKEFREFFSNR